MKAAVILWAGLAGLPFCGVARAAGVTDGGMLSYINDQPEGFEARASALVNSWRQRSELSWTVTNEAAGGPPGFDWRYPYTLDVHKFAPVTWVIETGPGFGPADVAQLEVSGADASGDFTWEVGTWSKAGDQQGDFLREMPEPIHGILIQGTSRGGGDTGGAITVTFWSPQAPRWGDLYSNCGGNGNRGWNEGFAAPDPDAPPAEGSFANHVLVPLPEPGSALLAGLAAGLWVLVRRRARRTRAAAG